MRQEKVACPLLFSFCSSDANSAEDIEKKIKDGEISEHPAWEDIVFLENLESAIVRIDDDIKAIQESS